MSLATRKPPTPFPATNMPDVMICVDCQRSLPVGRFVRVVDGQAEVRMRCDDCQGAAPAQEDAARLAARVEQDRRDTLRDLMQRLDVKNHDAPITQEVWAHVVLKFGGVEAVADFIYRNVSNLESEAQRIRACEVVMKLANASTHFEQNRQPLGQVTDEELDTEIMNLVRGLPPDARKAMLRELADDAIGEVEGEFSPIPQLEGP